jgi:cytochrome P450
MTQLTLDLRSPELRENPYPFYAELRKTTPVCRVEPFGFYAISRYDDVVNALKNHRVFSSMDVSKAFPVIPGAEFLSTGGSLLTEDPPRHTELRKVVNRSFTPQAMRAWEPRIYEIVAELTQDILSKASDFDFIRDFATPLPVTVICELLGVDRERREDFKRWSDDVVTSRSALLIKDEKKRQERFSEIAASSREMNEYFLEIVQRRRVKPGQDLVSLLLDASDNEVDIEVDELLRLCRLLLIAGNETTTNLLGNTVLALLKNPGELKKVEADASLVHNLVEEALRYDGPVLNLTRRVTEDVEVSGVVIPKGSFVLPLCGSANHDEKKFPDPEKFDVTRNASGHVAFGYGIHFCVGAPLARIEARFALQSLFEKATNFQLTNRPVEWLDSFGIRGLKNLGLSLEARKTSFLGAPSLSSPLTELAP